MSYLRCKKCLTGRSGDVLGEACRTPGCGGIIEEEPEFRTLVDDVDEPMRCPRRIENPLADTTFPGPDRWQKFKSNGNRVCSYCGSLHHEDLFQLVKQAAETPIDAEYSSSVNIEPSDKNYKIYVHQPGVRNAHEGGIKFYMQHLPRKADGSLDVDDEKNREYSEAVNRSNVRMKLAWSKR